MTIRNLITERRRWPGEPEPENVVQPTVALFADDYEDDEDDELEEDESESVDAQALGSMEWACQAFGFTPEYVRAHCPVTDGGQVPILDALFLYTGGPK